MKSFIENLSDDQIKNLRRQMLFSGLNEHEIFMFLQYAKPLYEYLQEGVNLRLEGMYSHMTGLMLSGSAYVYSVLSDGNKSLLKTVHMSESIMTYSAFDYCNTLIEITAKTDAEIIMIKPEAFFITDKSIAYIQHKILVNMIASQRQVFLDLSQHISCLSQRTIREKLILFFKICSEKACSENFKIAFSRDELASYLAVDRASLSRSLSQLKNEGLIDFKKERFTILSPSEFK